MVDQVNQPCYRLSMDKAVAIGEAKTSLSRLVSRVEQGEEIVIRRGPKPVARIVPIEAEPPSLLFGALRGRVRIDTDFDDPIPGFEPYG